MKNINRRGFLKTTAVAAVGQSLLPTDAFSKKTRSVLYVVHGTDIGKMLQVGMAKMGGFSAFVKQDSRVTIKPNAAWKSRPEQAGNTHPELVAACVKACKKAGAKDVILPENTVSASQQSFKISGIQHAVEQSGGKLVGLNHEKHFRQVQIPLGKKLKTAKIAIDVLDTDCLINMPVAKSHHAALLTLSMKNWMGSVQNRKVMHSSGLAQCIADLSTVLKPHLIIVDATRIMTTGGPRGPGKVEYPKQLILGTDPVSTDAYASTLFKKKPFDVEHIKIAHGMGIGCGDLDQVKIFHITT